MPNLKYAAGSRYVTTGVVLKSSLLSCLLSIGDDCATLQVHDRMTEQVYLEPLRSFATSVTPGPVFTIPVLEEGRAALEQINEELGLAFDEQDLVYYTRMFQEDMKRDPTNVELFDIAQSNSEHRQTTSFLVHC